ncbi:Acetyltransferase (GNAT) family protein [Halobacillus karajensis]|uniref:GNAT family N-acetyltransferase n=1 Tax=Halobacillus karajensis TaxID=195088 RepID=UPI0008A8088D|nr:GNAT family N-acetyltransferase [Halobacillus karajensis]SEH89476.1 Acetyltransferase (GNAT) family protein [Halobacillus karajensis]
MKTVERVKIVEYEKGYAAGIAKMWNESRENWGGDAVVMTEEDVLEKEAKSVNLHLFLAVVEAEVVGYCGLSEYKEDTWALYIPLLNVHPDYQGLKIGKKLLLQAIDKTVEYGWPRLDLFTWPGNIKAVPLYKKCGFFWEERDDTTHLMNFMPQVLQISALRPFFEKHDWYSTSVRPMEITPDGRKEKGFTFYEYRWEAGEEYVRVQFERTGRGMRLIETQDWCAEMEVPEFKLLENKDYPVKYKVENYTNDPFEVSLSGKSSLLVDEDLRKEELVENSWNTESIIQVHLPEHEPNPWKTHPVIGSDLILDGHKLPMSTGVFPTQAGKVDIRSVQKYWRPGQEGALYLDVESRMEEKSTWIIQLPKQEVVEWAEPLLKVVVDCKSRLTIPLSVELLKNGSLNDVISVEAWTEDGRSFSFQTKLTLAFPGFGGKFGGETDKEWYGYNGPYFVMIEKRNHKVSIGSVRSKEDPFILMTPKIGQPFSEEFSKKTASSVEYMELAESFMLKTSLESEAFPGALLNSYYTIYGDGLIEIRQELINSGQKDYKDLYLLQPIFPKYKALAIPEKDGVMIGTEALIPYTEYIRDKDISERWFFTTNRKGETFGVAWPKEAVGRKDDWRFALEYKVDDLLQGQRNILGPIQVGVNVSPDWSVWREMILGDVETLPEKPLFEMVAEGGIVSQAGREVIHSFRSLLTPHLYGELIVHHNGHTLVKEAKQEEEVTALDMPIVHDRPGLAVLSGSFHSDGRQADFMTYQFVQGKEEVRVRKEGDCWTVDNGVLTFSASSSYFPGIYSMKYQGREFLHHQYPIAGPKSWWNPWGGGIRYALEGVSPFSMMKEETVVGPVTKLDQEGNAWKGICLTTKFDVHEEMKGVTLKQYALTLPEVPAAAIFAEVDQRATRTFTGEKLALEAFFKPSDTLSSCYACIPTEGLFHTYYAGVEEYELESNDSVVVGSDDKKEHLLFVQSQSKKRAEWYMNKEVFLLETIHEWSASSGKVAAVEPAFLIIGDHQRPWKHHPFHRISFKGK